MADTEALINSAGLLWSKRCVIDSTIEPADRAISVVPGDIGSDDNDLYVLADIDRIRLDDLEAVRILLYPRV